MMYTEGNIKYTYDEVEADEVRFIGVQYIHETIVMPSQTIHRMEKKVFVPSAVSGLILINSWNRKLNSSKRIYHKYYAL